MHLTFQQIVIILIHFQCACHLSSRQSEIGVLISLRQFAGFQLPEQGMNQMCMACRYDMTQG